MTPSATTIGDVLLHVRVGCVPLTNTAALAYPGVVDKYGGGFRYYCNEERGLEDERYCVNLKSRRHSKGAIAGGPEQRGITLGTYLRS